ncbi:MAG: winged helix-turn-helix domain-containing protein [Methyloprofundus sp.]|nr:winged helix-turn-helix domain-containing protein [Methyloprofundus sp.]
MLARQEKHSRTRIRWLAMAHLQEGREYHEIATFLCIKVGTIKLWLRKFKADGLDGLRESPRSGARRKLDTNQEPAFKKAVVSLQEKREGGRITGYDIQQLLEEQFQIECCLSSVYNLLSRLNLVWITVRSKHPKQSEAIQEDFKKNFNRML